MPETITAVFPDQRVQWGQKNVLRFQTDVLETEGREQRRPRLPQFGRRMVSGDLRPLPMADRALVFRFLKSRMGQWKPFYIFDWVPSIFTQDAFSSDLLGAPDQGDGYVIGPGDGTTTLFTLPMGNPTGGANATTLTAAYVNGVQYPATLVVGGGTFGEDQLQFSVPFGSPPFYPPTVGALVGGGSLSAGNYKVVVTNTIAVPDGFAESFSSPSSNTVAVAAGGRLSVDIPIGPAGTVSRQIYRTVANGSVFKLDTVVANNTTVALATGVADGALGVVAPPAAPPNNAVIEVDCSGRLRIPIRLMSDDLGEAFVVGANILGLRHLDGIEVL